MKYTENEIKLLEALKEASEYTTELSLSGLLEEEVLPKKVFRGVISSLIKKDAIDRDGDFIAILDEEYQSENYKEQ
jgi:hypothetical protein